jgi:predicted hotdog family 3-hydroxylacyl-ACP dehydratase
MSGLPPVADAVPHAPPMLALDELVDWAPGHIVCRLVVREGGPFVGAAGVDGVWTLEYMAQAVAACLGCEALQAGSEIRVGLVVACRSMSIERALVPLGTELTVAAARVRGSESASLFETEVRDADGLVARAVMTVVHREGAAATPAQA